MNSGRVEALLGCLSNENAGCLTALCPQRRRGRRFGGSARSRSATCASIRSHGEYVPATEVLAQGTPQTSWSRAEETSIERNHINTCEIKGKIRAFKTGTYGVGRGRGDCGRHHGVFAASCLPSLLDTRRTTFQRPATAGVATCPHCGQGDRSKSPLGLAHRKPVVPSSLWTMVVTQNTCLRPCCGEEMNFCWAQPPRLGEFSCTVIGFISTAPGSHTPARSKRTIGVDDIQRQREQTQTR